MRDAGLLDSALARPINAAAYGDPSVHDLAAAYAFGIARNHPFVDGNKRTALVVSFLFCRLHGYAVTAPMEDRVRTFLDLAAGSLDEAQLAAWFERWLVPVSLHARRD